MMLKKLRKTYKASMSWPALAGRILPVYYRLRKGYLSSYFFWVFFNLVAFIILSILNFNDYNFVSYFIPSLRYLGLNDGVGGKKYSVTADYFKVLGGEGARVVYYLRVSTRKQARDGRSLDAQKEAMEKLIQIVKPSIVYGYIDPGKSGREFNDRKIAEIRALAKDGLIDEFWVAYIDRMGRNLLDMMEFLCILWRKGIYIRTPEKLYDKDNLSDVLMIIIECYMSEKSNNQRKDRANNSKRKNFLDKRWNKTAIPLGYIKNNVGWLTNIEEWVPIIGDIYTYFIDDESYASIYRRTTEKHKEIVNSSLSPTRIKSILQDPIYVGKPEHLGAVVDDASLIMVSSDIFRKGEERMAKLNIKRRKLKEKDPIKSLIEKYDIAALDFIDNIVFHHKTCNGKLINNGPRTVDGIERQTFLCKKCGEQFWVPNQTQMKKIREYYKEKTRTVNPLKDLNPQKRDKKPSKKKERKPQNTNLDEFFNY